MAKVDKDIPDLTPILIVLNGLLRSFEGTVSSIFNMDKLNSYNAVSTKLVSAAYRMKAQALHLGDEDQEALVMISQRGWGGRTSNNSYRFKKDSGQSSEDRKTGPICYCCRKPRHIARNCSESKYKPPKRKNKKVNAVEEESDSKKDEYNELEASIAEVTKTLDNHNWYLDLGASEHITTKSCALDTMR
jgi:hypothetical protein